MKTKPDGYVLCGDNQWVLEWGINDEQVLGVLKGFYRGERYVDCEKIVCIIYMWLYGVFRLQCENGF